MLAFVRRTGDETVACVFNLGPQAAVADVAGELVLHSGQVEIAGRALSLGSYAAAILRQP